MESKWNQRGACPICLTSKFKAQNEKIQKLRNSNDELREANKNANALIGAQAQENDKIISNLLQRLKKLER